eukprot:m.282138 g.282138  ORF g.282138 m.282138 type:complete len:74 (-) comp26980_c0_seq2:6211-6432(-)
MCGDVKPEIVSNRSVLSQELLLATIMAGPCGPGGVGLVCCHVGVIHQTPGRVASPVCALSTLCEQNLKGGICP